MGDGLRAMACNLLVMASKLRAMASNLEAMASILRAMASKLIASFLSFSTCGEQSAVHKDILSICTEHWSLILVF